MSLKSDAVLAAISTRRSCRKYTDQMPEAADLDAIVEAGLRAASGRGAQSPIVIRVTNKELRDRLSAMNAQVMGANIDPFYGAPAVLVVLANREAATYVYDGSLVMGNMMLAADALGYGSCWIHRAKEVFDSPEGKEILAQLGVTGDYEGIGHCVVGYRADEKPGPFDIRDGRVFLAE